ncbi:hypothetical protein ACQPZZ_00780 [Microbispora sp. CA-135349]|uniref:hypothetical protein n=1 Tax=Microbispora sp. CA-135349 TaxID=3239953 RepID=UPI003D8B332A
MSAVRISAPTEVVRRKTPLACSAVVTATPVASGTACAAIGRADSPHAIHDRQTSTDRPGESRGAATSRSGSISTQSTSDTLSLPRSGVGTTRGTVWTSPTGGGAPTAPSAQVHRANMCRSGR